MAFAYSVGMGGLERNVAEYRRLSRVAVELGNAAAASNLAGSYLLDETDEAGNAAPNYREALRWFRKAAELGDGDSALRLGDYYRDGEPNFGIDPNAAEAARWYRVGAEAGTGTRWSGSASVSRRASASRRIRKKRCVGSWRRKGRRSRNTSRQYGRKRRENKRTLNKINGFCRK